MLRMNFISLHVTNSADGGRRSYPKLSKCNKTAGFRPIPRGGGSGCGPLCLSPPVGECCPLVGCPLAPPLRHTRTLLETTAWFERKNWCAGKNYNDWQEREKVYDRAGCWPDDISVSDTQSADSVLARLTDKVVRMRVEWRVLGHTGDDHHRRWTGVVYLSSSASSSSSSASSCTSCCTVLLWA